MGRLEALMNWLQFSRVYSLLRVSSSFLIYISLFDFARVILSSVEALPAKSFRNLHLPYFLGSDYGDDESRSKL